MADIDNIRSRIHARWCHVLLIEGVPFAFTDQHKLTSGWWTADDRRILPGLTVPDTLGFSLDRETWLLEEEQASFNVIDFDRTIPGFFGGLSKPYQRLGERLPAGSDAIVAPLIGADQDVLLADEGGYIGTEAIGPSGQRGYYSCIPWANMPGQDHPTIDEPYPVFTSRAVGPLIVEGRRVALYRIFWDPDAQVWATFEEHTDAAIAAGRNPMFWWGTLRQSGKVDGKVWTIDCTGPGSWIRKPLANRVPTLWYPVSADVTFKEEERDVVVSFYKAENVGLPYTFGFDVGVVPDGSPDSVASYLGALINATSNLAGDAGVWTDDVPTSGAEGQITFDSYGCEIATLKDCAVSARMDMSLHIRVWRLLGYDPLVDPGSFEGPQPLFIPQGKDYYVGVFSTCKAGADPFQYNGDFDYDGNGVPRQYTPLYVDGASVLPGDPGPGGVPIRLSTENNSDIYCESQTIRPVPEGELDGTQCDSWRLWVFKGPLQRKGQEEPEDTIQIGVCSWRSGTFGTVGIATDGVSRALLLHEWLDPRLFGYNFKPVDPVIGWASNNGAEESDGRIQCSPLNMFGTFYINPDRAVDTLLRILLSTGTAVWDDGTFDALDGTIGWIADSNLLLGANSVGEDHAYPGADVEIYDMSLQIPKQIIDYASFASTAEDLPSGSSGPLAFGKCAIQGTSIQSEELIGALMSSRHWAMSLKRGRLGLWTPHLGSEGQFEEGVDFEITESDLHGKAGDPASTIPTVDLRPVNPFDRATVKFTGNPSESWLDGQREYTGKARDYGARARSGAVTRDVLGPDLISTQWFVGDQNAKIPPWFLKSWEPDFRELWEIRVSTWASRPNRGIETLRIKRPKGQDIYPGAILRLTNPWPANSVGGYGVTGAYARVLSVQQETDSGCAVVGCLLEAAPPNALKWAPIVRLLDNVLSEEDRYNASDRKFFVREDWGGKPAPLLSFIKPATIDAPDEPAKVLGLQYDGVDWEQNFSCFIESVSTATSTLVHTAMGLTGVLLTRPYTLLVLAPADDPEQAQWVRDLYAQHTGLPADDAIPKLPK